MNEHREIARYLSTLNRTMIRYRRSRVEEFTCEPLAVEIQFRGGYYSSRVAAYRIACLALGSNAAWGREL